MTIESLKQKKPLCFIGIIKNKVVIGTTKEPLSTFNEFNGTNTELLKLIFNIIDMSVNEGAELTEIKQFVGGALTDDNVKLIIDVGTGEIP